MSQGMQKGSIWRLLYTILITLLHFFFYYSFRNFVLLQKLSLNINVILIRVMTVQYMAGIV